LAAAYCRIIGVSSCPGAITRRLSGVADQHHCVAFALCNELNCVEELIQEVVGDQILLPSVQLPLPPRRQVLEKLPLFQDLLIQLLHPLLIASVLRLDSLVLQALQLPTVGLDLLLILPAQVLQLPYLLGVTVEGIVYPSNVDDSHRRELLTPRGGGHQNEHKQKTRSFHDVTCKPRSHDLEIL
jgi:hypothetical protein